MADQAVVQALQGINVMLEQVTRGMGVMAEKIAAIQVGKGGDGNGGEGGGEGGRAGGQGGGEGWKKDVLYGKSFDLMEKFSGGEAEWNEWSGDLKTLVETRSQAAAEAMTYVKTEGRAEDMVMTWDEVLTGLTREARYVDNQEEALQRFGELGKVSKELYRWLRLKTEGEAKLVVTAEEEEADGFKVWGLLQAKYNKRTMGRLMRLMQKAMYPKEAKLKELIGAILAWEKEWKTMYRDQPEGTKIPDIWKMAAVLRLCPKEITDNIESRWDEVGERYEVLKEKIVALTNGKLDRQGERRGGPVAMDVDNVGMGGGEGGGDDGGYEGDYDGGYGGDVGAVYPTTKCYNCQGYGHMQRECPYPKGKGKAKGGKDAGKGGFKGYQPKGGWEVKGGSKGEAGGKGGYGKGYADKGKGKGIKGFGKGLGYQGSCHKCGKVGHKWAECEWFHANGWVQEVEEAAEGGEGGGGDGEVGAFWDVGGIDLEHGCRNPRKKVRLCGTTGRCCKEEECEHEKRAPAKPTLDMWMPKKVELGNRFSIFEVAMGSDEEEEEMMIGEVAKGGDDEVEVTVDSGASVSVWPRKKKGVTRRKIKGRKPNLKAANGTNIEVTGEAVLEFKAAGGKKGRMRFYDSDVKKPLGAVSAMEDEGNSVVFSKKWGRYVENDETGERIYFERRGGTYVMKLKVDKNGGEADEMDVDANDDMDDEEMAKEVEKGEGEKVVFRRRMLA